jgi:hypothetical protein
VYDARLNRTTILDGEGRSGRTLSLGLSHTPDTRLGAGVTRPLAPFSDGSFLVRVGDNSVGPEDQTSVRRATIRLAHVDADGNGLRPLFDVPGDESFVYAQDGNRSLLPRAFGRRSSIDIRGDIICVAANTGFEYSCSDIDGARRLHGLLAVQTRRLSASDRQQWTQRQLAGLRTPEARMIMSPAVRAMEFPEVWPFHGDMVIEATTAEVWLERVVVDPAAPRSWVVFSRDGQPAAEVNLPANFRLWHVSADELLGVASDELGVERVVAYRVRRSSQ